jgi:uncharacterized lipoprotein YajG
MTANQNELVLTSQSKAESFSLPNDAHVPAEVCIYGVPAETCNGAYCRFITSLVLCLCALFGLVCTGCGLTTSAIRINYIPLPKPQAVTGADSIRVEVQVSDVRTNKLNVGKKGNILAGAGAIVAKDDLSALVAQAFETELTNRGFQRGKGAVIVTADILQFYNEFNGVPMEAVATVALDVKVRNTAGVLTGYSKTVTGDGYRECVMLSGTNAKIALEAALQKALLALFSDSAFVEAIIQAGNTLRQIPTQ